MFENLTKLDAKACFLGSRIDTRQLDRDLVLQSDEETFWDNPLSIRAGKVGIACIFKFGVVVFFEVSESEERDTISNLTPFIASLFPEPETEELDILINPNRPERVEAHGDVNIHTPSLDRLQVVAYALAKSTVLAHYEKRVAGVFDRIEAMASQLQSNSAPANPKDLLKEIGEALLIQARTVGRVEITEKPEITWDNPQLDRLYERLAYEYELRDRDIALLRKLDLISNTAQTYLDLLQNKQSIRVEWYIVVLIVIEIILFVYELFFSGKM